MLTTATLKQAVRSRVPGFSDHLVPKLVENDLLVAAGRYVASQVQGQKANALVVDASYSGPFTVNAATTTPVFQTLVAMLATLKTGEMAEVPVLPLGAQTARIDTFAVIVTNNSVTNEPQVTPIGDQFLWDNVTLLTFRYIPAIVSSPGVTPTGLPLPEVCRDAVVGRVAFEIGRRLQLVGVMDPAAVGILAQQADEALGSLLAQVRGDGTAGVSYDLQVF